MTKWKKAFGVLLSLAMLLSVSVSAYADNDADIEDIEEIEEAIIEGEEKDSVQKTDDSSDILDLTEPEEAETAETTEETAAAADGWDNSQLRHNMYLGFIWAGILLAACIGILILSKRKINKFKKGPKK